jgi:hypothetical protein
MAVVSWSAHWWAAVQMRVSVASRFAPSTFSHRSATARVSPASRMPTSRRPRIRAATAAACSMPWRVGWAMSGMSRVRALVRRYVRSVGRVTRCAPSTRLSSSRSAALTTRGFAPAGSVQMEWAACAASWTNTPQAAGYRSSSPTIRGWISWGLSGANRPASNSTSPSVGKNAAGAPLRVPGRQVTRRSWRPERATSRSPSSAPTRSHAAGEERGCAGGAPSSSHRARSASSSGVVAGDWTWRWALIARGPGVRSRCCPGAAGGPGRGAACRG